MTKLAILLIAASLMNPAYASGQAATSNATGKVKARVSEPKKQGFPPTYARNGEHNPDANPSL